MSHPADPGAPMAGSGGPRRGTVAGLVVEFDDPAGYGLVEGRPDDPDRSSGGPGSARWFFHCTAITDGSRSIEVGTPVVFAVAPGRRGQWEAATVRPVA